MHNSIGEFDFVVIGAGSAGCILAARLSESGAYRVAVIEAGRDDRNFWIRAPLGYGKLYDDARFNWLYESEPEPELLGARVFQPRGKVLGGTGSINGSVYLRGQRADFDHWRDLGNPGWGYDDVLRYFKKCEDNERGPDEYHGVGGPIRVSDPPAHELADAFIKAGLQAGYHRNEDFNGRRHDGFGYNQLTTGWGRRCSSADGYLRGAWWRPNLHIRLNALAKKILFRDGAAVGVEFEQGGQRKTVWARREIILAGGTFNSPQLLQASGIGPSGLLRQLGINVITDLPGVGENLQDHFGPALTYRCTVPLTVNDIVNNPIRRLAMGLNYLLFGKGMMTTNASFCGACIRTDPERPDSEVRIKLALWGRAAKGRSKHGMSLHPFSSFSALLSLQHPDSRGTVKLKSADVSVPPEIKFNYFVSERDRRTCVEGIRLIRRLMKMPAMAPYVAEEINPGPQCASDAELVEFCRKHGRSTHHASGTCKMGQDAKAVVDARLRVRGVDRLRVADASIMPRIVAANPNAAVMMIAEKGSEMILQDANVPSSAVLVSQ